MKWVRWLIEKLKKKIEPLDIKYHLDDIIIAYDDVDLTFVWKNKSKG